MDYFSIKFQVFLVAAAILLPLTISAQTTSQVCSHTGYTIVTINGVFTDDAGAKENKENLQRRLPSTYHNEVLKVDYLLNASHLGGLGDILESVYQGFFDAETVENHDLTDMLTSASEKVQTQKLLLVAHSQGNFYANSFYDTVADKIGGVPRESIGVYSVATPSGRVAGGGKWLTSDTDKVIAGIVGRVLSRKIMAPNTHIELQSGDDSLGHSFSSVYLKYRSDEIVADIKSSLDRLQTNDAQDTQAPCLAPPKLTLWHEIAGAALAVGDPVGSYVVKMGTDVYVTAEGVAITGYDLAVAAANGMQYAINNIPGFLTAIISQNFGTGSTSSPQAGGVARNPLAASMIPMGDNSPSPDAPAPQLVVSRVEPPLPAEKNKLMSTPGSTRSTSSGQASSPQAGQFVGQVSGNTSASTSPANGGGGNVQFGSVSETPPADQSNSPPPPPPEIVIPSIQNFQAKFSTSTLQIDLSWLPLDTQNTSTIFVVKNTTNGGSTSLTTGSSTIIETSSTVATFVPPDLHRSYDFSIQAFDGGIATSSVATTSVNVADSFARPSTPANFSLGIFDAFNMSFGASWSSSTDSDTPDNLLSYEFNYASSTDGSTGSPPGLLSDGWVATPSFQKYIHVDFPNTYTVGVRAKDDFGNISPPSVLHWNFPEDFVLLPSQLDHSELLTGGNKQSITITASTTIDAVFMWLHGNSGGSCCSQSYMRIFTNDGTLVATSDDTALMYFEEREGDYHFLAPVALAPGVYWLVPTAGPSVNTNGTWFLGSPSDTYPGGGWLDSSGADTGQDAYFRLRPR